MTSLHSCFENEASIVKFVIIKSFTQLIWQSKNNCMLCKARICSSHASVSTSFPQDSYIQTRSKCNSRILHIIELAKQEELHALQAGIRPSLREFEIQIHVNCPYKKNGWNRGASLCFNKLPLRLSHPTSKLRGEESLHLHIYYFELSSLH